MFNVFKWWMCSSIISSKQEMDTCACIGVMKFKNKNINVFGCTRIIGNNWGFFLLSCILYFLYLEHPCSDVITFFFSFFTKIVVINWNKTNKKKSILILYQVVLLLWCNIYIAWYRLYESPNLCSSSRMCRGYKVLVQYLEGLKSELIKIQV